MADELDAQGDVGDPFTIGFSPEFLAETLDVIDGDEVTMQAVSPLHPAVFRNGAEFPLHLLMPVRLHG